MRFLPIFMLTVLLTGCANEPAVLDRVPPLRPLEVASSVKYAETRYEMRSYREPANPALRHEPHAVYRRTRVPSFVSNVLESTPRTSFPPPSFSPLSASAELDVELAKQRQVTTDMRTAQATMADAEQKVKALFATLVRQSADVLKLKEQLETERNRQRTVALAESAPVAPASGPVKNQNPEVKW
ncbi:MAG: hypothetical protein QM715_07915 [Nibricoccus sp.]